MSGRRIAVIDADTLLYTTSLSAEMCAKKQGADGEDLWFQVRGVDECYWEVVDKFDRAVLATQSQDAVICLSDRRCFRYELLESYKANRVRTRRPPMMVHLREEVLSRQPFTTLSVECLEADDICGITSGSMQKVGKNEPVVVSEDKDLLSIPGLLHRKGFTFEVSLPEADRAHLYQALIGDAVDGYTGLPGVGPKKADAILDSAESPSVFHMYRACEAAFISRGLTADECLTQARVARILRHTDWDANNKRVKLWGPPIDE